MKYENNNIAMMSMIYLDFNLIDIWHYIIFGYLY